MIDSMTLESQLMNWPENVRDARAVQDRLAGSVSLVNRFPKTLRYIAGTDVGFKEKGAVTRAAIVVLDAHTLQPVAESVVEEPTRFPYVPGFLSFREVPALLRAIAALSVIPDVFLCDGQGIAHPRRFGLASHLGVVLDVPTVGVAKSRLCGAFDEPGEEKGHVATLTHRGEQIGWVLRSRTRVKPLFVSPGHRVDLANALMLTERCLTRYRLPETTRWADRIASRRGVTGL